MTAKINILFIHHATGWGGSPINMINIIKALNKEKYNVKVLLIKNSIVSKKLNDQNIEYDVAKGLFYSKLYQPYSHSDAGWIKWYHFFELSKITILWLLSRYYFSSKELKRHNCDIIHLNSSVLTDWLAPASKKCKVIYHIQEPVTNGTFGLRYKFFRSLVATYAEHIIAISIDNAKRINLPDKTTIIYNFAEVPTIDPPPNSYYSKAVLYLGGSAFIKGYFTLVDALDFLDCDVKVYFGGYYHTTNNPQTIKDLLKQIARLIIRKKYINAYKKIHNHPNAIEIGLTQNVHDYLNQVCCLVSPFSVPHFARPIIEAYLHKKPVIGSNVLGMDEIIKHGVSGLIVPRNNPKALAKAINWLTSDGEKAKQFGKAGFDLAIEKFTDKNILKVEHLYEKIQLK